MVEKDDKCTTSNHLDGVRGVYPALRGGLPAAPARKTFCVPELPLTLLSPLLVLLKPVHF